MSTRHATEGCGNYRVRTMELNMVNVSTTRYSTYIHGRIGGYPSAQLPVVPRVQYDAVVALDVLGVEHQLLLRTDIRTLWDRVGSEKSHGSD